MNQDSMDIIKANQERKEWVVPMNEPAFPSHGSMGEVVCEGMTIRDYFAAKAMQSILLMPSKNNSGKELTNVLDVISAQAYSLSDAMLKARGDE